MITYIKFNANAASNTDRALCKRQAAAFVFV